MNKIYQDLQTVVPLEQIKQNEPLQNYTFTKTGGKADFLLLPTKYEYLQAVFRYAIREGLPVTILGNGSNLIIRDGGIRGIVLQLTKLDDISVDGQTIIAQSGARIIDTSRFALEQQLSGLEFACGIPGSVGGAVYMNAGAYGGEMAHVLDSVLVLNHMGEFERLLKNELNLGYRNSSIAERNSIVLEATFKMEKGNKQEIKGKMDELTFLRESKQPLEFPSCGSVFKRPPNHFAGKLIQDSGLQGYSIGGAQVSTKHAGFIVNVNNASASDYLALIEHIQITVSDRFNVELEPEVKIIGED